MSTLIPQRTDEVVLYQDDDQHEIDRLRAAVESAATSSATHTSSSRWKWVKVCSTLPFSLCHCAESGACGSTSPTFAAQAVDGTSIMPPSRPFSGRRRSSK